MAYDPALHELILFGGVGYEPLVENHSLPHFQSLGPGLSSSESTGGLNGQSCSDGPSGFSTVDSDTWGWNGNTWHRLTTGLPGFPSADQCIVDPALVYDVQDQELLLDVPCNDMCYAHRARIWAFDSLHQIWKPISTSGTMPWNASGNQDLLPGAISSTHPVCTSKTLVGTTRALAQLPGGGGVLYVGQGQSDVDVHIGVPDPNDPVNHARVETWSFVSNHWAPLYKLSLPGAANTLPYPQLAPDANGTLLLVDQSGNTWTYRGSSWFQELQGVNPGIRCGAAMAYDPALHEDLLYGGVAGGKGGMYEDTWAWNGSSWQRIAGPALPLTVPLVWKIPTPPVSSIHTTRAEVLDRAMKEFGVSADAVQIKLSRESDVMRLIPDYYGGVTSFNINAGQLVWAVLVHCRLSCYSGEPRGGEQHWGFIAYDAKTLLPSAIATMEATSVPLGWSSMRDLSATP